MRQGRVREESQYIKKKKAAAEHEHESSRYHSIISQIVRIRESIHSVANAQTASYYQTNKQEDSRRKREVGTIIALAITAVVGFGGIVVTHRDTLKAIRETHTATDQQHADTLAALQKTDALIEIADRTDKLARRAWLIVEQIFLANPPQQGTTLQFSVRYQNTGKEPSTKFNHLFKGDTFRTPPKGNNWDDLPVKNTTCDGLNIREKGGFKGPGQHDVMFFSLDEATTSAQTITNILAGTAIFYLTGCLVYETIESKHHTAFCSYLVNPDLIPYPTPFGKGWKIFNCPDGHWAD